jgi:hypothetical protein
MSIFNVAEIRSITSEALQAKIRSLLPSQQGFGADLQSTNVIVPIVDLTAAAEGSGVDITLQQALAFGSQTAFEANNSTAVIANSTGFWRIFASASMLTAASGATRTNSFTMSDGLSTKNVWTQSGYAGGGDSFNTTLDFIVFLAAGESISAESNNVAAFLRGSVRQIADVNGNLINPSGFTPQ